jgi:hypothetical protein
LKSPATVIGVCGCRLRSRRHSRARLRRRHRAERAAVLQMGDDELKKIAHELVRAVRESASIDWT